MKDIHIIINSLISELESIPKGCDLSDIGNIIGIVIGKNTCDEAGYERIDFEHGIQHGFSLIDGTHDIKQKIIK